MRACAAIDGHPTHGVAPWILHRQGTPSYRRTHSLSVGVLFTNLAPISLCYGLPSSAAWIAVALHGLSAQSLVLAVANPQCLGKLTTKAGRANAMVVGWWPDGTFPRKCRMWCDCGCSTSPHHKWTPAPPEYLTTKSVNSRLPFCFPQRGGANDAEVSNCFGDGGGHNDHIAMFPQVCAHMAVQAFALPDLRVPCCGRCLARYPTPQPPSPRLALSKN